MDLTKLLLLTAELPPQPGGIGNHAHNLATNLSNHKYEVTVVADIRSKTGEEERVFDVSQNYSVRRIKRKSPIFLTYLKRFQETYKLLKTHDLLVVSGKFPIWLGAGLQLLSRKKIIAVVHGSEIAKNNGFTYSCLQRFHKIVAVSNYTKSLLPAKLQQKCVVIPNGFHIASKAAHVEKNLEHLRIITVGNVTQRKGQHNVIQALPEILLRYPELKYDIVGMPTEKESLITLARELGVLDAVVFHGKASETDKVTLLKKASVFIMLSEPTAQGAVEGFGIAILEANVLGLPAIGSRGCGIEDAISQNVSGKLVTHTNKKEIKTALITILDEYTKYSKNAVEWSQNFSWDAVIIKYLAILK